MPSNNITKKEGRSRDSSSGRIKSREGSPKMPRPRSEEIPLELIKKVPNSLIDMAPKISIMPRPQTPKVENEPSTSGLSSLAKLSVNDNSQPKKENIPTKRDIPVVISEETSFIGDREAEKPTDEVETV